jgi:hypothetical protein
MNVSWGFVGSLIGQGSICLRKGDRTFLGPRGKEKFIALKMEAEHTSETSVYFKTAQRYVPGSSDLQVLV